jgi:Mg-chelatase subunit ChlD
MANLVNKPDEASHKLVSGRLTSKSSSFKQRINEAKADVVDPNTMPNRICLMLDCSGSMDSREGDYDKGQRRIDLLKDAVQNFVTRCNFRDTSVAISTFPQRSDKAMPLTTQSSVIIGYSVGLEPDGGTPLRACVAASLEDVAMTRGVIVSDGGATDWRHYEDDGDHSTSENQPSSESLLQTYKAQGIPLDCVHISTGTDGEELLKRIAATTGGVFMKFTDVGAFAKAFSYLTPGFRAMLTSGSVTAKELGAKEIK